MPALGHAWVETGRQEPTSKTVGVITYTCQRCAKLRYEFIPKTEPVDTWKNPYRDVRSNAWYYEDVAYVTRNESHGRHLNDDLLAGNAEMSRAMLVTVLYRMNGSPSVAGMTAPFTDVPAGQWYTDAVIWAYNCGVVSGTSPTHVLHPQLNITREQMTTMFYGYAEFMDYNTMAVADLSAFPDGGSVSSWAQTDDGLGRCQHAHQRRAGRQYATYLRPQGVATRAEAAAILHRFDQWRVNAVVTVKMKTGGDHTMANLVITIGRENGSGGRQLGSELAAALGVKCYDSELINETAKASGFAKSFVETHEEQRPGSFLYSLVTGGGVIADEQPFPVQIFQAQSEVIRTIAARESCVIVGRCADYVLRDDPNAALVNLFVHAPMAARIRRESARTNTTPAEAEKRIRQVDKERAAYYNFFSSKRWGDAQGYDLCVNTDGLEISDVAKLVLRYLELRGLR